MCAVGMISEKDAGTIRDLFEKNLVEPVQIEYHTQADAGEDGDCQTCKQTGELLADVAALSPNVHLHVHENTSEVVPSFELKGKNRGRVRYLGIPAGYEFTSLIEDIIDVSRGETKLSAATREALAGLKHPVHIQVFFTPT
jgi:alkyl hydroperoxide reductase subunit AhpF